MVKVKRKTIMFETLKSRRKKKGSISLFLVIVIPVIILGGLSLFDLLWLRYRDEKALKIVSAVSEAHLSRYNEYLKKEYQLIAGLDLGVLPESVDEYFSENGYESSTESTSMSLDEAENFKNIVVKSLISSVSKSLYDDVLNRLGITEMKNGLSKKLEEIDAGMEKVANLISMPSEIEKMTKTRDISTLKSYIGDMKSGISSNDREFKGLREEMVTGPEEWSEILNSVESTMEDAEKKYEEVKKEAQDYAEKVENYIETIENCTEGADACFAQIEELEKRLKNGALSEYEIESTNRKIESLKAKMEEFDRELQMNKTQLDLHLQNKAAEVDKGPFDSLMRRIDRTVKRWTAIFSRTAVDGKILQLRNSEWGAQSMKSLSVLEKIAFAEWCGRVMSCYEKNSSIENRAIKGELEYIVSGEVSESRSVSEVKTKLTEIRLIPNYITFLQTNFKRELDALLSVIPAPFQFLGRIIAYSGAVLLESRHDVSVLLDGGKIPIFKKPSEWGMTLDEFLGDEEVHAPSLKKGMTYKDYLKILIFLQDEKDMVLRGMQLVDASIHEASGGEFGLSDYTCGHVIRVEYTVKSVFSNRRSRIVYENSYD